MDRPYRNYFSGFWYWVSLIFFNKIRIDTISGVQSAVVTRDLEVERALEDARKVDLCTLIGPFVARGICLYVFWLLERLKKLFVILGKLFSEEIALPFAYFCKVASL